MTPSELLAVYEDQIRRSPDPGPSGVVERDGPVVRVVGPTWSGVTWSDLRADDADAVISAQAARFAGAGAWEWTLYGHDRPADLADRLRSAGLVAEDPETLMLAEVADIDATTPAPPGIALVPVTDRAGADAFVAVHDEVFGGEHRRIGEALLDDVASGAQAGVLAVAGATPVAAARIEFPRRGEIASLWGGGTLPPWRGRGIFRAVVAYRAALAAARGYRYLHVDASEDSRPILARLGFVALGTTTPFEHPGTPAPVTYRPATVGDIDAVVALVESAYRGESSRAGWTTEADLLDGRRTDPAAVGDLIADPATLLLLAEAPGPVAGSGPLACCQLRRESDSVAYFGMFAVAPGAQGGGTGGRLLAEAEARAAGWGATTLRMTVIAQRWDLIAWYARRGYEPTGRTEPFPYGDERFGRPRRPDLHFVELARRIG